MGTRMFETFSMNIKLFLKSIIENIILFFKSVFMLFNILFVVINLPLILINLYIRSSVTDLKIIHILFTVLSSTLYWFLIVKYIIL